MNYRCFEKSEGLENGLISAAALVSRSSYFFEVKLAGSWRKPVVGQHAPLHRGLCGSFRE